MKAPEVISDTMPFASAASNTGVQAKTAVEACLRNDGHFVVKITDSPADYAGLRVQILQVEVFSSALGWLKLHSCTQYVDVLELTNGKELQIADDSNYRMKTGDYNLLRIVFGDENYISMGHHEEEEFYAFTERKMKFCGNRECIIELDPAMNQSGEVLLDFDVLKSVIFTGKEYLLSPSLKLIHDKSTGVRGHVPGNVRAVILLTDGREIISSYTDKEGNFLLMDLKTGCYTLYILPEKAHNTVHRICNKRLQSVQVEEGKICEIYDIAV